MHNKLYITYTNKKYLRYTFTLLQMHSCSVCICIQNTFRNLFCTKRFLFLEIKSIFTGLFQLNFALCGLDLSKRKKQYFYSP